MKKIILYIVALLLTGMLCAQNSFTNGDFIFSLNAGANKCMTTQYYLNYPENNSAKLSQNFTATNLNFTGEFGILKYVGLGLIGQFQSYLVQNDPITNTLPTLGTVDFGGTVNLHIVRAQHLDLLAGYDWGLSELYYYVNDGNSTQVTGRGTFYDIHLTARAYINRFGFNLNFYTQGDQYKNMQVNNSSVREFIVTSWRSMGYGATAGIQYRIF